MKKAKQRNLYEDKSDPVRNLDMQLDEDDDDIIELEDIIEMPDRPIDEDEDLDLGVEIFDMEEGLPSPPARSAQKTVGFDAKDDSLKAEEENLLDSFGIDEDEEELLFEPTPSTAKPAPAKTQSKLFDEEDDEAILDQSFLDELLAEDSRSSEAPAEKVDLKARAEAAIKVAEEERPREDVAPPASKAEPAPQAPAPVAGPSLSEISRAAEELIGRIEPRLQEHVRAVVESMLPGLVRSIIDEELAKLKRELE
jgi:hypothetical protein